MTEVMMMVRLKLDDGMTPPGVGKLKAQAEAYLTGLGVWDAGSGGRTIVVRHAQVTAIKLEG